MAPDATLRDQVSLRAGSRCEYCQLLEKLVSTPFQLDHVIAEKHAGQTNLDNLAWSCLHCNSFKGPNIAGRDEVTHQTVPLFNPRQDRWPLHFEWDGPILRATTAVGRVTIQVLRINLPERIAVRASLIQEGMFPA